MNAAPTLLADIAPAPQIFGGPVLVGGLFFVAAVVWFGLWLARRKKS